jgi:F0F1-type ATP synthase assembly protein I
MKPIDSIDGNLWLVSYSDEDDREMTALQIAAALSRGELDANTIVWRDGMPDWLAIAEVEVLKDELRKVAVPSRPRSRMPPLPPPRKPRPDAAVSTALPTTPTREAARLSEALRKVQEATADHQRLQTDRLESELTIERLRSDLAQKEATSKAHQALAGQLDEELKRHKAQLELELAAKAKERQQVNAKEAIENGLGLTLHQRNEEQHWRKEAVEHSAAVRVAWRAPLLDDDAKRSRRNLTIASALAILSSLLQIVPSKVTLGGFAEFQQTEPGTWPLALELILGYSTATFSVKAVHSVVAWRDEHRRRVQTLDSLKQVLPFHLISDRVVQDALVHEPRLLRWAFLADIAMPALLVLVALGFLCLNPPQRSAVPPAQAPSASGKANGTGS